MKNIFLMFLIATFCQPALSVDLDTIKLDAASRTLCSKNKPCSINSKGHDGTYIVKVSRVTINEAGIITINYGEYRRFIYNDTGEFLYEINAD